MRFVKKLLPLMLMILLTGCVTVPVGPSVRVMPAPGKPYDLFLSEDSFCRQAAERQLGIQPQEIANQNTATGAIIGTTVGAGLGAAIGAASGHAGSGAAFGAVSGLLVGSSAGSDTGRFEAREAQKRYDTVYMQCMYSYGNQVYNTGHRYYRRRTVVTPPSYGYDYAAPDDTPLYPPPNTPPPEPPPEPPPAPPAP